jgi:hypothetical protein
MASHPNTLRTISTFNELGEVRFLMTAKFLGLTDSRVQRLTSAILQPQMNSRPQVVLSQWREHDASNLSPSTRILTTPCCGL